MDTAENKAIVLRAGSWRSVDYWGRLPDEE